MGHTLKELCAIVGIKPEDAKYHIKILIAAKLVKRKGKVYHITKEGIELMGMVGITKKKVLEIAKKVDAEYGKRKIK